VKAMPWSKPVKVHVNRVDRDTVLLEIDGLGPLVRRVMRIT